MNIQHIPIFDSNYVWLLINDKNKSVVAVDPGDYAPLKNFLDRNNLHLTDILITHHHADHIGGVAALKSTFNPNVYAPAQENIPGTTHSIQDGDTIYLESIGVSMQVIGVPGHTLGHIAYYNSEKGILFCGDTLFSAGCGRIFEGTAQQMYASLLKLSNLPNKTLVYCTHEYTLNNLSFAAMVEADNAAIADKVKEVESKLSLNIPSIPSTIEEEKAFNPFLRCNSPSILAYLQNSSKLNIENEEQIFAYLRKLKDSF